MDAVMQDIRAVQAGDEAALERIVDRYLPLVKGAVTKVLVPAGQQELVGECINDIFFSVWKNIRKFKGQEEGDFRKWLWAVAKYRAIDSYRKAAAEAARRVQEYGSAAEDGSETAGEGQMDRCTDPQGSAEDQLIRQEEQQELERLMNLLSPADREIFIMKFYWGMKSDEISKRVGISRTAVDNRISRGRKQLSALRKVKG